MCYDVVHCTLWTVAWGQDVLHVPSALHLDALSDAAEPCRSSAV